MPFTFAHPAAVLPLAILPAKWRSVTGLIIGSISPDFEKFFRMHVYDAYSHTWKSIFYFNLPVAVLLSFLFHLVVRDQLIDHLPAFLNKRLLVFKEFNWLVYFKQHYILVLLSVLTGVFSHLCWDAFTHYDGHFLRWFPVLKSYFYLGHYQVYVYNFLQVTSSIAGILVVIAAIIRLPSWPVSQTSPNRNNYWVAVFLFFALIIGIRSSFGLNPKYIANLVVASISALLLSILLVSVLYKNKRFS